MEILANKNVLIVGATGGIGSESAKLIKGSQGKVYLAGRNESKLQALAHELRIGNDQIFPIDITNAQEVEHLASQIFGKINRLDILINATGIGIVKPLEKLSYDDFSNTVDVNLKGTFHLLKAFLPKMKEAKKGLFINIPGVLGRAPMAGAVAYAASKYGINGMMKSVREELRRTEVRITNIYLGGVDSPFWDEDIDIRFSREKFIKLKEAARVVWFTCQQPSSGVVSEIVVQPFNHQVI